MRSTVLYVPSIFIYINKYRRIYTLLGTGATSICILVTNGTTAIWVIYIEYLISTRKISQLMKSSPDIH